MSTDSQIVEFEDDRTWLEAESLWLGQVREAFGYVEETARQTMQEAAAVTRAAIDRRLALWTARGRPSGIDRLCAGFEVGASERWRARSKPGSLADRSSSISADRQRCAR